MKKINSRGIAAVEGLLVVAVVLVLGVAGYYVLHGHNQNAAAKSTAYFTGH